MHPSALQNGSDINDGKSRSRSLALATLLFVLFLTFLDNTIVTVVLANVQSDLHASVSQLQWVVNGYALTFAGLMLSFGTIGDLFGRKKVMLAGVAVFCAGSVIAAVAPTTDVLIAGRVVMGIGAAASEPGTLSMIRHLYPDRAERARSLGIWAAVSSLGLALGPLIGGLLVFGWSWRAIFWFNVFFGVLAFTSAAVVLPESSDPVEARFDIPGFLLGALALGSLTFGIILGETAGYRTWWIDLLFLFSLAGRRHLRPGRVAGQEPGAQRPLLQEAAFAWSNIIAFTAYFGTFAIFFMVALYLQVVASNSPLGLALEFRPPGRRHGGWPRCSPAAGWRRGVPASRWPPAACWPGSGSSSPTPTITPHAGIGQIGWTMFIAGVGVGMAMVPVTSAALGSVPAKHSGMAASTTNTFRELGAVVGVAVLGSIVNGQLTVNLVRRLTAIGIPKSYQSLVVSAVTTGTYQGEAKAATAKNHAITHIVNEVVSAAYGAFGHGLNISLNIAGGLLLGVGHPGPDHRLRPPHPPRAGQLGGRPPAPRLGRGGSAHLRDELNPSGQ